MLGRGHQLPPCAGSESWQDPGAWAALRGKATLPVALLLPRACGGAAWEGLGPRAMLRTGRWPRQGRGPRAVLSDAGAASDAGRAAASSRGLGA